MAEFQQTKKNRVRRHPERGAYDEETIYAIIDEALICHVAFLQNAEPFVIPTLHARHEASILLHGASSSRLMRYLESGGRVSLAFSLVDGLVMARSVFSHSINYRSVVLFGRGEKLHMARADETDRRHHHGPRQKADCAEPGRPARSVRVRSVGASCSRRPR